jgi:hypothetical protein
MAKVRSAAEAASSSTRTKRAGAVLIPVLEAVDGEILGCSIAALGVLV